MGDGTESEQRREPNGRLDHSTTPPAPGDGPSADDDGSEHTLSELPGAIMHDVATAPGAILRHSAREALVGVLEPTLFRLVDAAVHEGMSLASEEAPDGAMSDRLERQVDDLVRSIVKEMLDAILTGPAAAELEVHGRHLMSAALHREGEAIQSEASAALSALVDAVAQVLRTHRKDLVAIGTRAVTTATVGVAKAKVEAAVGGPEAEPGPTDDERDEPASQQHGVEAVSPEKREEEPKGERHPGRELHHQLNDAGSTLLRELSAQTDKLQQRLREEAGSAVKKGTQNQNLGRAPTGRHPSARHGVPRGPSQGAPGTRRDG